MQTRTADDGAFVMEWYAPAAVTALGNGEYQTSGSPFKTSAYKVTWENGVKTVTMTRQQGELPPYTITRIEQGNLVTIIKGTGDETIIRTIETNQLYGNMSEIIESVRGINDATPVSCTRELKQNVNGTWLLISRTEAFNTEIAQTTTYEYNADLRIEKVKEDGWPTVNVTTRCCAEHTIPPAMTNTATANRAFSQVFMLKKNLLALFKPTDYQARNQYE